MQPPALGEAAQLVLSFAGEPEEVHALGHRLAAIRSTIAGFDATQHFFANHSVELDGDRATDLRYMQARHVLGDAHYTIGGYYTGEMRRTRAGWRIARYRLTFTWSEGDRHLMGIAYRKSTGKA